MNMLDKVTFFPCAERCIDVPKSIFLLTSTYNNIWPDNELAER